MHAIDIDRDAVANTLSNAFRNGVADRMSGEDVDLYQWTPKDRYDLDRREPLPDAGRPVRGAERHRPLDYWGRNQLDHFLTRLPRC